MNDSEYLAWVEIFCQARGEGPLLWAVRGGSPLGSVVRGVLHSRSCQYEWLVATWLLLVINLSVCNFCILRIVTTC